MHVVSAIAATHGPPPGRVQVVVPIATELSALVVEIEGSVELECTRPHGPGATPSWGYASVLGFDVPTLHWDWCAE